MRPIGALLIAAVCVLLLGCEVNACALKKYIADGGKYRVSFEL